MEKVYAEICNKALPPQLGGCGNANISQGGTVIGNLISAILGLVFLLGFFLAMAYFLTGGVQWITSGGDKGQLEAARNKITNAVIGLILVAASYAVFKLVGQFFGFTLPTIPIPTIGS